VDLVKLVGQLFAFHILKGICHESEHAALASSELLKPRNAEYKRIAWLALQFRQCITRGEQNGQKNARHVNKNKHKLTAR
jgi:hypothetical protein